MFGWFTIKVIERSGCNTFNDDVSWMNETRGFIKQAKNVAQCGLMLFDCYLSF